MTKTYLELKSRFAMPIMEVRYENLVTFREECMKAVRDYAGIKMEKGSDQESSSPQS